MVYVYTKKTITTTTKKPYSFCLLARKLEKFTHLGKVGRDPGQVESPSQHGGALPASSSPAQSDHLQ